MARKSRNPTDMSALLNLSTGTLAQIKAKTNSLTALEDIVRKICPDLPDDVWNITNIMDNTLVIEVKSPVWGQRLQFERGNICKALVIASNDEYQKIQIKVNPMRNRQAPPKVILPKSNQSISSATSDHLEDIAKNAPEGLKQKLLKLALHGKRKG
jgi:hypothetical protein